MGAAYRDLCSAGPQDVLRAVRQDEAQAGQLRGRGGQSGRRRAQRRQPQH